MKTPMAHDENKEGKADTVRFVYQKGRHHRSFHADGAWAAVTPKLEVQFSFFSDLRPLPETTDHILTAGGDLEEIARQISTSITRETDVTVVMQKEAVASLIEVLQRMVTEIDAHIERAKKTASETSKPVESSEVA